MKRERGNQNDKQEIIEKISTKKMERETKDIHTINQRESNNKSALSTIGIHQTIIGGNQQSLG